MATLAPAGAGVQASLGCRRPPAPLADHPSPWGAGAPGPPPRSATAMPSARTHQGLLLSPGADPRRMAVLAPAGAGVRASLRRGRPRGPLAYRLSPRDADAPGPPPRSATATPSARTYQGLLLSSGPDPRRMAVLAPAGAGVRASLGRGRPRGPLAYRLSPRGAGAPPDPRLGANDSPWPVFQGPRERRRGSPVLAHVNHGLTGRQPARRHAQWTQMR